MAKTASKKSKAEKTNKAELIRNYKTEHKDAKPKEIVAALAAQGHVVTPQQVSTTLSNAKKAGMMPGKRGRKPGSKNKLKTASASANGSAKSGKTESPLDTAIAFVKAAGGLDKAEGMLATIRQIKDSL